MNAIKTACSIRPFQPVDEPAIEEITYRTGFKGEDLTGRGYFDDRRLFFLIFIGYYTRFEPEHCFVAEAQETGQVVGFICGTPDTTTQEAHFQKWMIGRIALRAFGYSSWRYPRSFKTLLKMMPKRQALPDAALIRQIEAEYPGHLHINLLPGFQGVGIGSRLMRHFEVHMRDLGVPGLHLSTSSKNLKAVPFYHKMGFSIVRQSDIVPHPNFSDLRYLTFAKKL